MQVSSLRKKKWENLTPQEIAQIDRRMMTQIHAERHTTVHIISEFLEFLRIIGNQGVPVHNIDMTTPAAMSLRRRSLERNKK